MPGNATNGLPIVAAPTQNGVALSPPNGTFTNLTGRELVATDTEITAGAPPQTVASATFQLAALVAPLFFAANQATSTVHAATLNTQSGVIVTESLSTAAGATYTFTLTNSQILATSPAPLVSIASGTNTGGNMVLTSITNAAGSSTFVFTNAGTTALNGTMVIAFHV